MEPIKLYTIEEVSEILKITPRTIYNYIKNQDLEAVKIGKYWRIKHSTLQAFIEERTVNN
ncbi:MAG: helix-turn-helix domain-containing protein [Bacillota bacterium]